MSVSESVQLLSRLWLFATPWTAGHQASLSITNSWSLLKLMSIESVMPSYHLILCYPLSSCPQSFQASGSFQMSQLFASGGQSIGVSASTSGIRHSFSKSLWSSLAASWEELTHWKRLWCWEGLGAGGEGDDRGWDGWKTSLTRWTWVWVNSRSWWWTGRPGVLQFMGLQRVEHDWATEMNWTELNWI